MTSKDTTDRPKDTCAQFVVKSFRRAQEHPMGRQMCAYMASTGAKGQSRQHPKHFPTSPLGQYYAGSSPLSFGGRKRSGAFGEIWPSATNVQSAGI